MEILQRLTLLLLVTLAINAADFSVNTKESAPPKELSDQIHAVLEPKAIQLVQDGKPVLELWLRKDVPLKDAAPKLSSIAETTLIGAVAVRGQGLRDYKDNEISAGIFTARYLLQPQDGDHLGTAEFNFFTVLVGADADKELGGLDKFKSLTKASGKLTASGHPSIMSLRPVSGDGGKIPSITEPASEHKALRLGLTGKGPGGEKVNLPFDLVFEGHGHIQ